MASFIKSTAFKRIKNLIIGVGASVVLLGALFKILSWPYADEMLMVGMFTEAGLFLMLGILPPDSDYYWEKLYPGLNEYNKQIQPLAAGSVQSPMAQPAHPLNGEVVEKQLSGMLTELGSMSKSLSSLKSLQEVDFSGMKDQLKTASNFYTKLNEAMSDLEESAEATKAYKVNLDELNKNINSLNSKYASLNQIYGGVISAMSGGRQA